MQRVYITWIRFLWTFSMSRSHRVEQQYFWSLKSLSLSSNWGDFFSQKQISEHLCSEYMYEQIKYKWNKIKSMAYKITRFLINSKSWQHKSFELCHAWSQTYNIMWQPHNGQLDQEISFSNTNPSTCCCHSEWAWSERARQLSNQQKITL